MKEIYTSCLNVLFQTNEAEHTQNNILLSFNSI